MNSHQSLRLMQTLGVGSAILNLVLAIAGPWLHESYRLLARQPKVDSLQNYGIAMQELLVYFDPIPNVVLSIIFTAGLAAIPFLLRPLHLVLNNPVSWTSYWATVMTIVVLETTWLSLTFTAICCRGPNWNFYLPFEPWELARVEANNSYSLSEWVWRMWLDTPRPQIWYVREFPGFLLIGLIYVAAWLMSTYCYFRTNQVMQLWRWIAMGFLLTTGMLLPLKIACLTLFGMRHWITLPEFMFQL